MKRRSSFPGVTAAVDRHGKLRWRFRKRGQPSCYLPGEYGSAEFRTAYQKALSGETVEHEPRAAHGTFDWLIEQYMRTSDWQRQAKISKRNLGNSLDRFRRDHGHRLIAELRAEHVEALMAQKIDTPAAANGLLKLIRRLCRFALRREFIRRDPTFGVRPFKTNADGYHVWTDAEIERFESFHGIESLAVRALRLALYTGAARQDLAAMGRQHVRGSRIGYRRGKTDGEVDLPIMPELDEVLSFVPADQLLFMTWGDGRPYKPETFGNWFHEQCVAAGLPHCPLHGLRKAGATRLANAGATEFEVMAFLGHKTPNEARTYTKKANRTTLGDSGMAKLRSVSNPIERLDNHHRK